MLKNIPIKSKLQTSFLIFGMAIILAAGWQAYEIGRSALEEVSFHRLTSVRETKKRQIELYFEQLRNSIITIAENPAVHRQAGRMMKASAFGRSEQSAAAMQADSVFGPWLKRFQLASISIVSPSTHNILYTTARPHRIQHILEAVPGPGREVQSIIAKAASSAPTSDAFITDIIRKRDSVHHAGLFVAVPLLKNAGVVGVLLAEMDIDNINRIMTDDDEWRIRGMGQSGETYIVGADYLMRTDSRFLIDTPTRYINALQRFGYDKDVIRRIKNEGTTIMYQRVDTRASRAALEGETGIQIVDDYRGVPVLSSYSPLRLNGLDWVILAEIDTKEAFAAVVQLQENLIFTALIMFLIAAVAGYVLSRNISTPLQELASASEHVGKGDLDWRVEVDSRDELGHLADAFNAMAANLQKMTAELQSEVRVRHEAEQELQNSHEQLRQLSAHLQSIREDERKRLAREIHDELGQSLTAIKMDAAMLERRFGDGSEEFKERIADMSTLIQDTIISVKRITSELRPGILDDLGLSAAIEWQAEEFMRRTHMQCDVSLSPPSIVLEPEISTALFRIFQETLTNVARHADAQHVCAKLVVEENAVHLEISDDGKGIASSENEHPASFGILGMRERANALAGSFAIRSGPEGGTSVHVSIPLREKDGNA